MKCIYEVLEFLVITMKEVPFQSDENLEEEVTTVKS